MIDVLKENWELATSALFLGAVLTGLAAAMAGGSLGVLVLLRREAMVAVALPQVVLLGTAAGLRYLTLDDPPAEGSVAAWLVDHTGWPTLPAAVDAVLVALLLVSVSRARQGERAGGTQAAAAVLPAIYAGAVCAAILIVKNAGNHLNDVQKKFVGIEVAVDDHLAEISVPVLLACGVAAAVLWRRWVLVAQAPAAAQLAGLRPARWDALFLALLSAAVLVGTNALGPVLTTALLFLPAATVLPWARRVPAAIVASVVLAVVTFAGGFVLSNWMDWPSAHSVGGLGFVLFLLSYLASRIRA